jgi:hypothetical protein
MTPRARANERATLLPSARAEPASTSTRVSDGNRGEDDDDRHTHHGGSMRRVTKTQAMAIAGSLMLLAVGATAVSSGVAGGRGGAVRRARGARFLGMTYEGASGERASAEAALGTSAAATTYVAFREGAMIEGGGAVNPWLSAPVPKWSKMTHVESGELGATEELAVEFPQMVDVPDMQSSSVLKGAMPTAVKATPKVTTAEATATVKPATTVTTATPTATVKPATTVTTTTMAKPTTVSLTAAKPVAASDPDALAMCDFTSCNAKYMMVDERCKANGGLGCVAQSGCRYCTLDAADAWKLPGLPKCAQCVCDKFGLSGCDATLRKSGGNGLTTPQTTTTTTTSETMKLLPTTATSPQTTPTTTTTRTTTTNLPLSEQPTSFGAAIGHSEADAMCDWSRCDARSKYQMFDKSCKETGGLGCIGHRGCRFCRTDDDSLNYEHGLPRCSQCVCDKYGVSGCRDSQSASDDDAEPLEPSAIPPWVKSSPSGGSYGGMDTFHKSSDSESKHRHDDDDDNDRDNKREDERDNKREDEHDNKREDEREDARRASPTYQNQPTAAYQTQPTVTVNTAYANTAYANTNPVAPVAEILPDPDRFAKSGLGNMQETGPVDPLPEHFRIGANGVDWQQTKFGDGQSCQARCQEIGKTCSDLYWPRDMNQLRDVISRTTPSGTALTCNEIRVVDPVGHCSGVASLSGRCFLNPPMGLAAPTCMTPSMHSDCTTFCPCTST